MDTTNEPVAWITMSGLSYQQTELNDRPLYTNPVKELTDELETALLLLDEAITRYQNLSFCAESYAIQSCEYQLHDAQERARAILRKAQEK